VGSYEHKNEGMHSVIIIIIIIIIKNFQPAEWLLASQRVCSMKVVISTNTKIQLHSTSQLIKFVHQEFWNMLHTHILHSPLISSNSSLVRWVSGIFYKDKD
jgi:Mn2+/Fe2+ NRAMP family transporter